MDAHIDGDLLNVSAIDWNAFQGILHVFDLTNPTNIIEITSIEIEFSLDICVENDRVYCDF